MLAQGGMGEVYLAKLTGAAGFEKLCIVKTILQRMSADKQFVDRFHHEARVLVQLTHANIAQVYDMGELDQSFYMAMEYIAGVDLARIEDRATQTHVQVPVPIGLYVGQKIAEALGYAHRKASPDGTPLGIVHRDVSPQNVMVSYEGEVKVIDFGLAKSAARSKHTQPSTVLGKLGYMSPEQARGESVDHKSDIYSCGVVVWELLAGRQLFLGQTVGEMVALMSNPRVPAIRELRPEISEGLEKVLLRALAANPADRYARADDFARGLNEQLVREGSAVGAEEVGNYIRGLCPEEFVEQRKLISKLSTLSRTGTSSPSVADPVHPEPSRASPGALSGTAIRTTPTPGEGLSGTAIRTTPAPVAAAAAPVESAPAPGHPERSRAAESFTLSIPKRRAPLFVLLALAVIAGGAGLAVFTSRGAGTQSDPNPPAPPAEPARAEPSEPDLPKEPKEPKAVEEPKVAAAEPIKAAAEPPPAAIPRKRVEVKKVFELFMDRGERFIRAGRAEGLNVGARVQVVTAAKGKWREQVGEATAMEVWPHLARLAVEIGPVQPKEALFGAFDPRAKPPRLAARPGRGELEPPAPPPAVTTAATEPPKVEPAKAEEPPPPPKPVARTLKGRAWFSGMGPLKRVNLQNNDNVGWNRCEVRLPTNQRYVFDAIPAGESDVTLLRKFVQDGVEKDVDIDFVTVKCQEGTASFPIR